MVLFSGPFPEKRICKACSMVFIGCSMAFLTTWPIGENMSVINSIILTVILTVYIKMITAISCADIHVYQLPVCK